MLDTVLDLFKKKKSMSKGLCLGLVDMQEKKKSAMIFLIKILAELFSDLVIQSDSRKGSSPTLNEIFFCLGTDSLRGWKSEVDSS